MPQHDVGPGREHSVCVLRDLTSGASASILTSYGFNLFDLRLPVRGEPTPIVFAEADFAQNPSHPARSGIPVLFPYPNRVRNARFTFAGRTYQLPEQKPPHAIHGFALDACWDVIEQTEGSSEASLTGRFQISRHAPDRLDCWPCDATLQARYTLSGARMTLEFTVSNPSSTAVLPYGLGIHPYFFLPLPPGGDSRRTRVVLPASSYWVLKDCLPTGEIRPVTERLDFRHGQPRAGLTLDDILTGISYQEDWGICELSDLDRGVKLRIRFDRGCRELVVFTPSGRDDVIAVEPYTQTTDAINLQSRGVDAGLHMIEPGGTDQFTIVLEVVEEV